MFRSTPDKTQLLDQLDLEIEEHRRTSRSLRKEFQQLREEAQELLEDGLEDAAKGRLKSALYVRKLRGNKENMITNLQTTRMQLMAVRTERPTSKTLENVSKLLRQSRIDRERTELEFDGIFTDIEMEFEEPSLTETFGVQTSALDAEFEKLMQETGMKSEAPAEAAAPVMDMLPSIPTSEKPAEEEPESDEKKKEKISED
ncbi:hypothetical protein ISS40_10775 [Candidatus Bathyarchaeota archaeon]|nr:hypothetical protein [Candidatus Bathyarchaeota archaeon]